MTDKDSISNGSSEDAYSILGIKPGASFEEVQEARNKKLSCQTRLLGLEANIIMAMNSNFKRKEAKNIIDTLKKYC